MRSTAPPYTVQNGDADHSLRFNEATGEFRIRVEPGEKSSGDSASVERWEIVAPRYRKSATRRRTVPLKVVEEGTADWVVVLQDHTGNDAGGRTPNWAFYLEGGALIFRYPYFDGDSWENWTDVPVAAYALGQWLDIIVTHREHLTTGQMTVSVNGSTILNVLGTAGSPVRIGAFDEEDAPYDKIGV